MVSLENANLKSVDEFFTSLSKKVETAMKGMIGSKPYPIPELNPTFDAKSNFMNLFQKTNEYSKGITFLVDEGDVLTQNPEVGAHFLLAMREMKHLTTTFRLQGFVLVGVESILSARNNFGDEFSSSISPFSMTFVVSPMRFTVKNIKELLQMYVDQNEYLDADVDGIANDIFERTLGHRGITGVCLCEIENMLKFPTLRDWKIFAVEILAAVLITRSHYQKIVRSVSQLNADEKKFFNHVIWYGTKKCDNWKNNETVQQLLTKGIIVESRSIDLIDNDYFEISSPLLRQAMLKDFNSEVKIRDIPPPIPNLKWIVRCCVQNLQKNHLIVPEVQNSSTNFTSEYAFQAEFVSLLKEIFKMAYSVLNYKVLFEVKERDENGSRTKRLDILIRDGNSPKFAIELLVSNTEGELIDHVRRATEYKNLHTCQEAVVVRFWNKTSDLSKFFETGDVAVSIFHVIFN
ncbi:ATP-dependent RNA helicase, partial [Nowakowskiella sp. JEL0078]